MRIDLQMYFEDMKVELWMYLGKNLYNFGFRFAISPLMSIFDRY